MRNVLTSTALFIALACTFFSYGFCQEKRQGNNATAGTTNNTVLAHQQFHFLSNQSPGLIIPLYIYPESIHTHSSYNRVMELKRRYPTIPFWVIVNPSSGPGESVDANYAKAIDRLIGSGCMVLGYVATGYSKKSTASVSSEIDLWRKLYPRTQGIFFDEMINEDNDVAVGYQKEIQTIANRQGFWPIVANPGTDTPIRYFASNIADVIVVHESDKWPEKAKLHGDYFGGYADYPPFTRATLVYSQKSLDVMALKTTVQFAKWIYVTDDTYQVNDPKNPNPWDQLSNHLELICKSIQQ